MNEEVSHVCLLDKLVSGQGLISLIGAFRAGPSALGYGPSAVRAGQNTSNDGSNPSSRISNISETAWDYMIVKV